MDLIYTNQNGEDVGVLLEHELDLAVGEENDFELTVPANQNVCEAGSYIYIEDTEYGGIVDSIESDTTDSEVKYTGRTWHGILNSKILVPDPGQDYLVVNGEANSVLRTLLARVNLTGLFTASASTSGLTVSNYKMDRYIAAYDGIKKMLATVSGKLLLSFDGSKVNISAVPIADYTDNDELDSDRIDFKVKKAHNKVNHLICLGKGELKNRTVVHLYSDENGTISQTQTFTGIHENVATYENSNSEDETALIEDGTKRFKELLDQDDISVSFSESDDSYDIGDIVGAYDQISGVSASVVVTKKIVNIRNGLVSISFDNSIKHTSSHGESGGSGESLEIPIPVSKGGTGADNASQALANLGAVPIEGYVKASNPNLLDNPWFTINQRGQTTYYGEVYTVDRWVATWTGEGTTEVLPGGGIRIYRPWYNAHIRQVLGTDILNLIRGQVVTISVLVENGNAGFDIAGDDFSFTTGGTGLVSATFQIPDNVTWCHFHINNETGYPVDIKAAKLELGSVSTLANDAPPDYATELYKCKRYYQRFVEVLYVRNFGSGNDTFYAPSVVLQPEMRTAPSVLSGLVYFYNIQGGSAPIYQTYDSTTYRPPFVRFGDGDISYWAHDVQLSSDL